MLEQFGQTANAGCVDAVHRADGPLGDEGGSGVPAQLGRGRERANLAVAGEERSAEPLGGWSRG